MKYVLKNCLILFLILVVSNIKVLAGWEILCPDRNIRSIVVIDDTWFGIERTLNGLVLKMLLVSSEDKGITWNVNNEFPEVSALTSSKGNLLVKAVMKNTPGYYLSKDKGKSWKNIHWPLYTGKSMIMTDSTIFISKGKVSGVLSPVYRTTDEGKTWQPLDIDVGDKPFVFFYTWGNFSLHNGDICVFVGHVGFFISSDGGNTWELQNDGLPINETNYGEYDMGILSNASCDLTLFIGSSTYTTPWETYRYKNGRWELYSPNTYYYEPYYDDYRVWSTLNASPTAYRYPYLFSIQTVNQYYGSINYSVDNGEKWFKISDPTIGTVYWDSYLIDGGYLYAGTQRGFARWNLSQAINHTIKTPRERFNISPEESMNSFSMLGSDTFDDFWEEYGLDTDELTNVEMDNFINKYFDGISSDLFSNSQPGTCNYMGMPSWSMNVANLKLFVRDVIFKKQGVGSETRLALNYTNPDDSAIGIFGKCWHFEYETSLLQKDSAVIMYTGSGARFVFTENIPVIRGASPYTLACLNNNKLELKWDGNSWQVEKNRGAIISKFTMKNDSVFILKTIEDAFSNKTTIGYNGQFKPVSIIDASGREYRLTYNNGMCDSIIAPDNRFTTFTYSNSLLSSSVDLNNTITNYSYDSLNNIISADISGKITGFEYNYDDDPLGMISVVTDPENRKIDYSSSQLDSVTILTTVLYPGNNMKVYHVQNGQVVSITNGLGDTKKIYYNNNGFVEKLESYNGDSIIFDYDANNNVISKTDMHGDIYNYTYDSNNNMLSAVKSPNDTLFAKTYNTKNQILSIVLPGESITTYEYDEHGALSKITSPGGKINSFSRDIYGNIVSYTNPLGNTMSFNYDDNGLQPVSCSDFTGNLYDLIYDNNGRLNKINLPDGNYKTINYDCCVQTGKTDENGNTISVVRDATNRVLSYGHAEGWSSLLEYNQNGFISGFTTKYGMNKELKYNENGLLESVSDDDGEIKYTYNNFGQRTSVTDKKGNKTTFTYNGKGKIAEIVDAADKKTVFDYNINNYLSKVTNSRDQNMEILYNEKGLVKEKRIEGNQYAFYKYDADGYLISYTDSLGTTEYTRNSLGFVTSIKYPDNKVIDYVHDANGNITSITYPNGLQATNTVDKINRITQISWTTQSVNFQYDAAGYPNLTTRSNNTKTSFAYNNDYAIINIGQYTADTIFAEENVTLSNGVISKISIKTIPDISASPVSLLGVNSNKLNQLTSTSNGYSFIYDADGNLTTVDKDQEESLIATYSQDNLLSGFKTKNTNIKITYDAMRYPRKIVKDNITSFVYFDYKGRLLFETDDAGNVTRSYIYRGKRLIAMQTAQNETYYYHCSRLGHIVAISDENGSIVNSYTYSSGGEILGKKELIENRFTFLGSFGAIKLDDEYILTGARVYFATTGRYIQRDPLGLVTGTNQYLYAGNNPVTGIDPLGFDDQEVTINTLDIDPPTDNDYGTAAGTANPYAENLPYRSNDWDTYGSAATETANDFSDHPAADLIPDFFGNPISTLKAIEKLEKKDYGGALWQFVPFNNSIDATIDYLNKKAESYDSSKSSGLGIFGDFNKEKTFSCDM